MDVRRIVYISDYFYNNHTEDDFFRDEFFFLKLHALFNCLTPSEIKILYLQHCIHCDKFKNTLLSFIEKKAKSDSSYFSAIAIELIEEFSFQTFNLQIAYRTFLSRIIQALDKEIIRSYFHLFVNSERINDRKKSYEVAKYLWNDIQQNIWDNFYKFQDEGALVQIIYNSDSYELAVQLRNLWKKDFPNNKLKKLLIDKTRQEDISYFQFIKKLEPTFYVQAKIVRNEPVNKELIDAITKKFKRENTGYLFYYLGLVKDWNLLINTIATIENN